MAKKTDQDEPKKHKHGEGPPVAKQPKAEKKEKGVKGGGGGKETTAPNATGKAPKLESRLHRHYREVATPKLIKQFGWKNKHQVPRIEKVKLNVGLGEASKNAKLLD